MKWFPPAETKVPLNTILSGLNSKQDEVESKLCSFLKSKYCVFGPSAKVLLYSLLSFLKKEAHSRKDEVLIPGYTCYSVAASVVKAGLKIRVYDINPQTLSPVMETVEKRCSNKTLAIVSQHLFGLPSECDGISAVSAGIDAFHIEDAAQGFGGSSGRRAMGTIGDFGIYSFGRGKPLPVGGGGALVSRKYNVRNVTNRIPQSKGYLKMLKTLITQIMAHPSVYRLPEKLPLGLGKTVYDPSFSTGSISQGQKAILESMLGDYHTTLQHRQEISKIYRQELPASKTFAENSDGVPAYCRFPIRFGNQEIPLELYRFGVRRMYPFAIIDEPSIMSSIGDDKDKTPGATDVAENLATLPTHMDIDEKMGRYISKLIKANIG